MLDINQLKPSLKLDQPKRTPSNKKSKFSNLHWALPMKISEK